MARQLDNLTDRERKLPQWAQERIESDRRQLVELRSLLDGALGVQERTPFFTRTHVDGAFRTTYMPASHRLEFETSSIRGEIVIREELHSEDDRVSIYFDAKKNAERVYIEPAASNTVNLITRER